MESQQNIDDSESDWHRGCPTPSQAKSIKRRRVASGNPHAVAIAVKQMSFIVNGHVEADHVYKALREEHGDVATMHEHETATIDVAPRYLGLETSIHVKRGASPLVPGWHCVRASWAVCPMIFPSAHLGRTG